MPDRSSLVIGGGANQGGRRSRATQGGGGYGGTGYTVDPRSLYRIFAMPDGFLGGHRMMKILKLMPLKVHLPLASDIIDSRHRQLSFEPYWYLRHAVSSFLHKLPEAERQFRAVPAYGDA